MAAEESLEINSQAIWETWGAPQMFEEKIIVKDIGHWSGNWNKFGTKWKMAKPEKRTI
jgi:hypothetical protein